MRTIKMILWVWWLYFITIPGVPMRLKRWFGDLDVTDIRRSHWVVVQAFGRVTYADQTLAKELDRLFATLLAPMFRFSKLYHSGFKPGPANEKLAEYCDWLWTCNPGLVLELQWEVAYCLWKRDKAQFSRNSSQVNVIWPGGSYFATYHVAELAARDIRRRGLDPNRGIDLSHPDMIIRAIPIAWKQGLNPLPWVADVPFAGSESIQPWTRGAGPWFIRETLTRVHHLLHLILPQRITALKPPTAS